MRLEYHHIDAFTGKVFAGNPAGVCILDRWLPDSLLQSIAAENNLAETAFLVPNNNGGYHLRWFTPTLEVDLCGHATLAPAHLLFTELGHKSAKVEFETRSGRLTATRRGDLVELDFPSRPPEPAQTPEDLLRGLGAKPREVLKSRDYLVVFDSEAEVIALSPNFDLLTRVDSLGVIATARGTNSDFVSRFFAPRAGIPEDPATGSSHCTLIPYWSGKLKKSEMFARQLSKRGGEFYCRDLGDRVAIGGRAVIYGRGHIEVPD